MRRSNWKPNDSSVLCSEHFTRDSYRCPPGNPKGQVRLKDDAKPTLFPNYPTRLQPQPVKKRRTLVRVTSKASPTTSSSTEPPQEGPSTSSIDDRTRPGRPKIPPEVHIPRLRRRVKTLSQKVIRLRNKARIQSNMLRLLQRENKLQQVQLDSIDGCLTELVKNQAKNKNRKTKKAYSQKIKEFSLTIYFYSPRTYAYLRTVFTLPAPRSLRRWLESVDCEPGFLTDVISLVSTTAASNAYSLVLDSMAIRKRLIVEKSSNKVLGHVTIGNSEKVASEALVFLLVPILGAQVRHPIGYFLVDKVDSDLQSQLIQQCLKLTAESKIRVVNVTCDGCASNVSTLNKLGASIPSTPYFKHPQMDHKVYTTLDAVHMLKLARNALGM